ncbi:hypothetical protein ACKUFS_17730 [Pseudomonas cannabina]|uniref:Lipoprotein n=1 Tax=Pseudomonas syringae pv. maculicola str. ES4326 TaxID=629265 RepID=A0A8T8C627_PSEYM|nr:MULTISPECIES: hypothetical protein [Pseudomonas syringae group]QHE98981.1 hypothetical protein PMA4326_021845 [Pseudomonas syringae pv. maculicola str. ES4326]QQN21241.1 hypothetical protein JGS08_22075 [Pseudomonas cannabina pv. alisalensis]UBY99643.1 hypothetical protein LCG56_11365 [Pseudomonas cannabina pv. alisalensis]
MRILIGMLALALLAGCSSSPMSVGEAEPVASDELYAYQSKPAGESGKVTVIRDRGFVGSGCDIVVYVDGRKAAKIGTGQRATFYLKPGSPSIGAGLAGSGLCAGAAVRTISANVQSGHESIYRITGDMGGFYIGPYVEYQ